MKQIQLYQIETNTDLSECLDLIKEQTPIDLIDLIHESDRLNLVDLIDSDLIEI